MEGGRGEGDRCAPAHVGMLETETDSEMSKRGEKTEMLLFSQLFNFPTTFVLTKAALS